MCYGWITSRPEPSWLKGMTYQFGDRVRVTGPSADADVPREGVVVNIAEGRVEAYHVLLDGEFRVTCHEAGELEFLSPDADLPLHFTARPVLGDGTLVRVTEYTGSKDSELVGRIAATCGLRWDDDGTRPVGYRLALFDDPRVMDWGFCSFEVLRGATSDSETRMVEGGGRIQIPVTGEEGSFPAFGWVIDSAFETLSEGLRFALGDRVRVVNDALAEFLDEGVVIGGFWNGTDEIYHVAADSDFVTISYFGEYLTLVSRGNELPIWYHLRPVLGDGTVVRVRDAVSERDRDLAGKLGFTEGLCWYGDDEYPHSYCLSFPGERGGASDALFDSIELVRGET